MSVSATIFTVLVLEQCDFTEGLSTRSSSHASWQEFQRAVNEIHPSSFIMSFHTALLQRLPDSDLRWYNKERMVHVRQQPHAARGRWRNGVSQKHNATSFPDSVNLLLSKGELYSRTIYFLQSNYVLYSDTKELFTSRGSSALNSLITTLNMLLKRCLPIHTTINSSYYCVFFLFFYFLTYYLIRFNLQVSNSTLRVFLQCCPTGSDMFYGVDSKLTGTFHSNVVIFHYLNCSKSITWLLLVKKIYKKRK